MVKHTSIVRAGGSNCKPPRGRFRGGSVLVILTPAQTPMEGSRSVNHQFMLTAQSERRPYFGNGPQTAPALANATDRAALPPPPPRSPRSHGALVRSSPPSPCMRGWTGTVFRAAAARSPAAAIGAGSRCLCTASNSLAIAPLRFSPAAFGQPVGEIGCCQLVQAHALRCGACRRPPFRGG